MGLSNSSLAGWKQKSLRGATCKESFGMWLYFLLSDSSVSFYKVEVSTHLKFWKDLPEYPKRSARCAFSYLTKFRSDIK